MTFFRKVYLASLCIVLFPLAANAEPAISNLVVKMPVAGQEISAGYFNLANQGAADLLLVGVSSSDVGKIEMHTHEHANGMMAMKKLDSVSLPAGGAVEFVPGGHHLMVFSIEPSALSEGVLDLVFEFDGGQTLVVEAVLEEWR